jgi:peptidoglycan/LPS O-acetylase OafA/YrhL
MKKENILAINLLRFFAACGVLFNHVFGSLVAKGYILSGLGFFSLFTQYGYLGVDLFFIISGFVISLSSEGRTFSEFVGSRFIRLFPVFWICVSISTLFIVLFGAQFGTHVSLFQYLFNLTMLPLHFGDYPYIDGSYWTLEIELKFYTLIAVILLFRKFLSISLEKLALFLSVPLLYYTFLFNPYSSSFVNSLLGNVFVSYFGEYAQEFIAGVLFYGIYKNAKNYYNYIGIAICYLAAINQSVDQVAYFQTHTKTVVTLSPAVVVLHVTVFFGLFLVISLRKMNNDSFLCMGRHYEKILITLGALTYPLYLLHSTITHTLINLLSAHNTAPYIAMPIIILVGISLLLLVNRIDLYIHAFWKQTRTFKEVWNSYVR